MKNNGKQIKVKNNSFDIEAIDQFIQSNQEELYSSESSLIAADASTQSVEEAVAGTALSDCAVNLCCCTQNGITVIQPKYQNSPSGTGLVSNPYYDGTKTYWKYKFMTDCIGQTTHAISHFLIPICSSIDASSITVYEKIDGCGTFTPVVFTLTGKDNPCNITTPPTGFQYLKVENVGRYDKGVTVEYLIVITGKYDIAYQSIFVFAGGTCNEYTGSCGGSSCYQVPQCIPGQLSLTKNCSFSTDGTTGSLIYNLTVTNSGSTNLTNVHFHDEITIPLGLNFSNFTTTPALNVDTTGMPIIIDGDLGPIDQGHSIPVSYTIPITGATTPGSYTVNNVATVSAPNTSPVTTYCSLNVKVCQVTTEKCCVINGNVATYYVTIKNVGASPAISVDVTDTLTIPKDVTIQFSSFSGCNAVYDDLSNVPLNTNITGLPTNINIACTNLSIPVSGSITKSIVFNLVSSSFVGTETIKNIVKSVTPSDPTNQIFLGSGTPVEADINVTLGLSCANPCVE